MKPSLNIVKKWEKLFNENNLNIVNTYASDGVLIGTFAIRIKKTRQAIYPYFEGLFKKENLKVQFENDVFVNEMINGYIVSGFYTFSYTENYETKKIRARYSFAVEKIKGEMLIVNHHSSTVPNE